MLLGTTFHKWKDDVARQTLMLAEKQGLKQIVIITEEKQKIIDELQRQIYELLQRPAADGVDELRAEIDALKLMLSTANDEKAIQIAIIILRRSRRTSTSASGRCASSRSGPQPTESTCSGRRSTR